MLKKLNTLMIIVLLAAVLTTGLVALQVIGSYNSQNNEAYLTSVARLVSLKLAEGIDADTAGALALSVFTREGVDLRITVVDSKGVVTYDNQADPGQMENHLFRAEIAQAFKSRDRGTAIRTSPTLRTEMLYIALYEPVLDLAVRASMPLYHSRAGIREFAVTIFIVMAVALAVLVTVSALTTRWITRPLQEIIEAASVMSGGRYDVRIHQLRQEDNEVSVLGQSFNAMADRLQQTVADLADRSIRLDVILNTINDPVMAVTDSCAVTFMNNQAREVFGRAIDPAKAVYPLLLITHSQESENLIMQAMRTGKPVTAELNLRTEKGQATFLAVASPIQASTADSVILTLHDMTESRRLQKMRSDFVANVTHELRTPLTSIRGFIETLREGAVRKPEVAERFLEIIDIEAERLHKLINDILTLSEIEEQKHDKDVQPFDLTALIDDVAVLLEDTAVEAKVSLVVEDGQDQLPVQANPSRIKQVLINLVENAIKYNVPGGKVFIRAHRQESGLVELIVRDTGVGIDKEHQDRVFERFYRVDRSRSRELGGTGLGLSIVKHIAQLYGGVAKVESKPGEGATFTVTLDI